MELIQTVRNFFGEKVAFYIFWMTSFNRWLTFLAIFGVIMFILITFSGKLNVQIAQNSNIDVISLLLLLFCIIVAAWATFFIKAWKQTEQLYAYLWGMQNIEGNTPYRKEFKYDKKDDFVFDKKIPFYAYWKKAIKLTISYIIMAAMCAASILAVNGLFKIGGGSSTSTSSNSTTSTNSTLSNSTNSTSANSTADVNIAGIFSTPWPILIGFLNGIQIQITSWMFTHMSLWLNDWENHEKNFQYEGSMIIKKVCYEVINNYNSLIYISFFKNIVSTCTGGNCMYDLNVQVYTILITKLTSKFAELKGVTSSQDGTKKDYKEKYKKELETQSLHHQRGAEEYNNLIADYNEMLILFGYVVFFSSAAPLTPLIAFAITYMKKLIDSYKFFNCKKVNIIMGANGIEIYNYLFTVFYFLGLLTNVAVVLFANTDLANLSVWIKFIIFLCVENAFVITIFLFRVNTLPHWFNNTNLIKNQYFRKFFNKDSNSLPHHQFVEKKKPEWDDDEPDSDDDLLDESDVFEDAVDEEALFDDDDDEEEEAEEENEEEEKEGENEEEAKAENEEEKGENEEEEKKLKENGEEGPHDVKIEMSNMEDNFEEDKKIKEVSKAAVGEDKGDKKNLDDKKIGDVHKVGDDFDSDYGIKEDDMKVKDEHKEGEAQNSKKKHKEGDDSSDDENQGDALKDINKI